MSNKTLRIVAGVAAVAVNFIPGLGTVAALGIKIGVGALLSTGIALASGVLLKPKSPKISREVTDRLTVSMIPDTPRKIVFGHTAMATDLRYQAYTGTDQEYYHQILCVASHEVESIDQIWFDSELVWSAAGGVAAKYSGYLTVQTRTVGTSGNGIAIDGVWTAQCTLTGCAYVYLRFKLTGNSKKAESPFSSSVPTRVTVKGKGAKLPDVRDTADAEAQATWEWFSDAVGRNPALQLLFYLLGWRINGKLAIGRGIPADRLDLDSFITAANLCDEPVALAAGGTEPRYRSDGIFSEADDPSLVIGNLCGAMNAVLRDVGGRLGVYVLHNDLSAPMPIFTEADILGDDDWEQTPPVDEFFNRVRGRYVDASDAGLFQLVDFPEVAIDSVDGIERIETLELAVVQSASQAQRLSKTRLQRNLYRGVFSATFNHRAWQVNLGDPVKLSHAALGWSEKLFRVAGHSIGIDGQVAMVLQEEHASIYAWDAEEAAPVTAATPTSYDATKSPIVGGISDAGKSAEWPLVTDPAGTRPANNATNTADPNSPFGPSGTVNSVLTALANNSSAISSLQAADGTFQSSLNTLNSSLNSLWSVFGTNDSLGFRARVISLESISGNTVTRVSGLEATLNTPTTGVVARLGTLEQVTATNDQALASRTTAIESEITNARNGFGSLSARFGSFTGTVADALNGKASVTSVENLTATVNGYSSSITNLQEVTADHTGKLNATAGLRLNAGGKIAGFLIHANNSEVSTFDVMADVFRISDGTTTIAPFTVANGEVLIHGKLAIFSSTSGERIEATNNLIQVLDSAGDWFVRVGKWVS